MCLGTLGRQDEALSIVQRVEREVDRVFQSDDPFVQKVKTISAQLRDASS